MTTEHLGMVGAVVLGLLLGIRIGRAQSTATIRRRSRRRQGRAIAAERDAAHLLRALGYRVLEAQAAMAYDIELNGEPLPVEVRADYLVTRDGFTYVAEVKSGAEAPSVHHANTRRQLLEYALAYEVDGTLLVDMEAGAVHAVAFPEGPRQTQRDPVWLRGAAWALAGALALHYGHRYFNP